MLTQLPTFWTAGQQRVVAHFHEVLRKYFDSLAACVYNESVFIDFRTLQPPFIKLVTYFGAEWIGQHLKDLLKCHHFEVYSEVLRLVQRCVQLSNLVVIDIGEVDFMFGSIEI